MARYGINVENAFGVSVYELRRIREAARHNHVLASHCGRRKPRGAPAACFVDDPALVSDKQMELGSRLRLVDNLRPSTTSLFD